MIEALGFFVALAIGGILGLLGGGGSILAVPAFVYLLKVETKGAIIGSLLVVAVSSLVGGISGLRRGEVELTRGALFITGSIPGAIAGGMIGSALDERVQLLLFAVVMITAAVAMLRRPSPGDQPAADTPVSSSLSTTQIIQGILAGLFVGMLTGIVGAGGGFVIVPALTLFFGVSIKRAISTSMLLIALNSFAGLIGYFSDPSVISMLGALSVGETPYPLYLAFFTLMMTIGVTIGTKGRSKVQPDTLRRIFAYLLIALGVTMVVINVM